MGKYLSEVALLLQEAAVAMWGTVGGIFLLLYLALTDVASLGITSDTPSSSSHLWSLMEKPVAATPSRAGEAKELPKEEPQHPISMLASVMDATARALPPVTITAVTSTRQHDDPFAGSGGADMNVSGMVQARAEAVAHKNSRPELNDVRVQVLSDRSAESREAKAAGLRQLERRAQSTGYWRQGSSYRSDEFNSKVTLIIKTFERKPCLISYLESIREYYPKMPILIAD